MAAILANASSLILFHNHPSGDCKPSEPDIMQTLKMYECGELMGIDLLDHIIIGTDGKYCSLKSDGYFQCRIAARKEPILHSIGGDPNMTCTEWRRLTAPPFVSPQLMNSFRNTDKREGVAENEKTLMVIGARLSVPSPNFIPGETVYVRLRQFFEFLRKEDWDVAEGIRKKEAADNEVRMEEERQRLGAERVIRRQENRKFNLSFGFPAKFTIGQKSVRSGLLENSWGDGRNKRSMYHVVLQETISLGKLYRKENDFLCSREPVWHQHVDALEDYPVSCKACLQMLKRYGSSES